MVTTARLTQADRLLTLETPLEPDTLVVTSFKCEEAMSSVYRCELEMMADIQNASSIKADQLVGQLVNVKLAIASDYGSKSTRFFSGIINRFSQGHSDRRFVYFRAEMVPWLWLLSLKTDCRIFQNKTVNEIVETIFKEFADTYSDLVFWRDLTSKTYTRLDYCVQYRESSLDFVLRLLEREGICFFFEHTKDKHTLVLADAPATHKPCPEQPSAVYVPEGWQDFDNPVLTWEHKSELRPGKYMVRDYHMQMPRKPLEFVEPTKINDFPNSVLEVYEYPGDYARRFSEKDRQGEVETEGSKLVRVRMEEQEVAVQESFGTALCRGFTPGYLFTLKRHYDSNVDGSYLLTSVRHSAVQTPWYVAEDPFVEVEQRYSNDFSCIPAEVPYRPARRTAKPTMQGPQTAQVVGPAGEEIYTDEFSRVKVQFHWDRLGKKDDKSSCWIRVSQPWAGKGWGTVSIPRIGQEVIVDFLEGDPDEPIITGRVYNAEVMPPYSLPGDKVVSGMKSNSSPGGGGYNEISCNDTKNKEAVTIHAQYDMTTTVQHDDTQHIVTGNRKIDIDTGTHTETIKGDTSITITTGAYSLDVANNTHTHHVKGKVTENYDNEQETKVASNVLIQSLQAKVTVDAAQEIYLHCGDSMMKLISDGTILISGKNITISGEQTTKIGVGNQNTVCDVTSVVTSGANITSNATGTHDIVGNPVKIN